LIIESRFSSSMPFSSITLSLRFISPFHADAIARRHFRHFADASPPLRSSVVLITASSRLPSDFSSPSPPRDATTLAIFCRYICPSLAPFQHALRHVTPHSAAVSVAVADARHRYADADTQRCFYADCRHSGFSTLLIFTRMPPGLRLPDAYTAPVHLLC
jgi:hypothetical protein